ncbi:hypothetical protein RND81_06G143700 [Saponaria officinalis]|uniref:PUM-HD domain-containing protein n=1 Tax=Saponaria officinalis TaxID=3572 RepID=A0AAW1KBI7_SAPOF
MYPSRNGDHLHHHHHHSVSSSPSSSYSSMARLHDHTHASSSSHNFIAAFDNLSLSNNSNHNPPEENGVSNESRTAAMYLPQTLDDSPVIPPRNGLGQQIGSNRGMAYYSSMSPSPYNNGQQSFAGMPPELYPPNMFTSQFNPFACNIHSPPIGYQFPDSVTFPGLTSLYPRIPIAPVPAPDDMPMPEELQDDVLRNPYSYITNPSFNRPITKLLHRCRDPGIIDSFVLAVTQCKYSLVDAACTYCGTCILQMLIKVAKKRSIVGRLPEKLAHDTVRLMTNQSGMNVVKQCFIELDDSKYEPLFDKMMENNNWVSIAKDKHGCRALNECLDNMVDRFKSLLHTGIALFSGHLALDIYGTYIVQHVIDLRTIHTEQIVESVIPFVDVLVTIKNGSHLFEKCLDTPFSSLVVEAIIKTQKVVKYAIHEFGNYVVQKAIKCTRVNTNIIISITTASFNTVVDDAYC